jgi:DNA uptake protein ComE-like DNA-binding protein
VMAFRYYDSHSPLQLCRVSLNQGSAAQFCQIPGITPPLAQAILAERHRRGYFRDIADFQRRLNLPSAAVATLMHHLHC